jgi:hypothetical protein
VSSDLLWDQHAASIIKVHNLGVSQVNNQHAPLVLDRSMLHEDKVFEGEYTGYRSASLDIQVTRRQEFMVRFLCPASPGRFPHRVFAYVGEGRPIRDAHDNLAASEIVSRLRFVYFFQFSDELLALFGRHALLQTSEVLRS